MLGNTSLTVVLGSTPPNTADEPVLLKFTRELCKLHLPVLLIQPGTKLPLDMRSSHEKKQDPRSGVHMATDNPTTLKKYIRRARRDSSEKRPKTHPAPLEPNAPLNFAVRLRGSGYVVVDADTPQEVEALKQFLAPEFGGLDKVPAPTVLTPGGGGHSGGGHWWFKLPDTVTISDDMPAAHKVTTEHGSFSVYLNDAYVLIPPSTRPEGPYTANAPDNPLPITLAMELKTREVSIKEAALERQRRAEERAAHLQAGDFTLDQSIAEWAQSVSWEELLTRHGWHAAGTVDGCGCSIFTRPGAPSSPKSATAHEASCSLGRYDAENAPLHVWTDNAPDEIAAHILARNTKTISKLTFVALMEHGGDMTKAINALGIKIPMDLVGVPLDSALMAANQIGEGSVSALTAADSTAVLNGPSAVDAANTYRPEPEPAIEQINQPWIDRDRDHAEEFIEHIPQYKGKPNLEGNMCVDNDWGVMVHGHDPDKEYPEPVSNPMMNSVEAENIHEDEEALIVKHDVMVSPIKEEHHQWAPGQEQLGSKDPADGIDPRTVKDVMGRGVFSMWGVNTGVNDEEIRALQKIRPGFADWQGDNQEVPKVTWDVDGLIEHRGFTSIIGTPGAGKSFVALDMILHMATGKPWQGRDVQQQNVLYVIGEGLPGVIARVREWEIRHEEDLRGKFFMIKEPMLTNGNAATWAWMCALMLKYNIKTVVFDTLSRMIAGTDENSSKEMNQVINVFDKVRTVTGAGVVVVHHTSKSGGSGRGSSALQGALDSEIMVEKDHKLDKRGEPIKYDKCVGKPIRIRTTKVKNGEGAEGEDSIKLSITKSGESALLTDRVGNLGAPTLGLPDGQPAPVEALTVEEQLAAARAEIERLKAENTATVATPEPVAEPAAEVTNAPAPTLAVVPDPEPAPAPVAAPVVEQAQPEPNVIHLFGVPSMAPELVAEPDPEPAPYVPTSQVADMSMEHLERQALEPNPMFAALAKMELDKRRAAHTPPPTPVPVAEPAPVTTPVIEPEPVTPPVQPTVNPAALFGTPSGTTAPTQMPAPEPVAPPQPVPVPTPPAPEPAQPMETVQAPLQPFGTPPVAVSPFLNPPPQVPAGLDFEGVAAQVSSIVFGKLTGQPPWETVTVTDVLAELRTNVPLDGVTATKLVTYLLGELATVGKLTQASQGTYRLRT